MDIIIYILIKYTNWKMYIYLTKYLYVVYFYHIKYTNHILNISSNIYVLPARAFQISHVFHLLP